MLINHSHEHKLCPLLAGLFLDSYEVEFIQKFLQEKKRFFVAFNATLRYVDDVLSVNNSYLSSYVNSIYPSEHEIKDNTDSGTSASYFDFIGT